jgi:hypothetical protein
VKLPRFLKRAFLISSNASTFFFMAFIFRAFMARVSKDMNEDCAITRVIGMLF